MQSPCRPARCPQNRGTSDMINRERARCEVAALGSADVARARRYADCKLTDPHADANRVSSLLTADHHILSHLVPYGREEGGAEFTSN